jgi:hypothetical protein
LDFLLKYQQQTGSGQAAEPPAVGPRVIYEVKTPKYEGDKMSSNYLHDVFISFAHGDIHKVRVICSKMESFGLKVFFSDKTLEPGKPFPEELEKALLGSQHFVLYFSESAAKSEWVGKEWKIFLEYCNMKDKEHRRMYILKDKACLDELIPPLLRDLHRPKSDDQIITEIIKITLGKLKEDLTQITEEKEEEVSTLRDQLEQEVRKVHEARNYYQYHRFWRPIAENGAIHIFTCGRDVKDDPNSTRGYGGRTNIDVWDYRAVLAITHFFSSRYPSTKIIIEDPTSKLHDQDFTYAGHLADRIAYMRSKLEDKDCIIVGSPDVSDYAEILLAHIHYIDPYTEGRVKQNGFVIIKDKKYTTSSFYWEKKEKEEEGVAQIIGGAKRIYFPNKVASEEGKLGKLYGILIIANNPFINTSRRRIMILSGFSGIATNAIAKLITDELYLLEFFKLDNEYIHLDRNIEALIGVEYAIDKDSMNRDTRQIKKINFEKLVEI